MSFDVIFDLDGTLVDSVTVCTEIVNAMLIDRSVALRVSHAETRRYVSVGGPVMIEALMGEHCGDPKESIKEFRARYAELPTPPASLFAGVREGLLELASEGCRLSICSSKPQNLCEKVLRDLGLADAFALIVGSGPDRPAKPDPALYAQVLAELGAVAERSCLVGDSELDYALAKSASAPFVLCGYGYLPDDFKPADAWYVNSFHEVPDAIMDVRRGVRESGRRAVAGA